MPSKPVHYLSTADVLLLHRDTLEHEGGLEGIRSVGLLESAVAMPRQRLYGVDLHPGLAAKAAAYLYHIAANHPFFDGNKRAVALAALVFLDANGVKRLPKPDDLQEATLRVADGRISKSELIEWMQQRVRK